MAWQSIKFPGAVSAMSKNLNASALWTAVCIYYVNHSLFKSLIATFNLKVKLQIPFWYGEEPFPLDNF